MLKNTSEVKIWRILRMYLKNYNQRYPSKAMQSPTLEVFFSQEVTISLVIVAPATSTVIYMGIYTPRAGQAAAQGEVQK